MCQCFSQSARSTQIQKVKNEPSPKYEHSPLNRRMPPDPRQRYNIADRSYTYEWLVPVPASREDGRVKPTDVQNPNYYHKVVDCQWACPAHTNVPEYIRLIAQGRYTDAYMLNRESNVFPAILGRTCDRPCEPACRRGRLDGKPVAICRLKRVAADLRDDISARLPKIPTKKNGKRIACIGAGPASLTVANDLMPQGYEVVMFEKYDKPGGLMRTNIPAFRLPDAVLMDEVNQILNMGVDIRYTSPIES